MDRRGFLSSSLAAAAFPLSDAATVEVEEPDSADGGWRCYGFDDGNTGFAEGEGGPVDGVDVRWSYDTGGAVLSSPSVVSGSVYVGSWSGGMHRLDVESGEVEWWFETGGRRDVHGLESGGGFPVDGGVESGPCVDGESVYFGAYDGYLYSLDRGTGEEQWRYGTPSILRSSPVVVDETVYIGDWTGDIHAVEAGSGEGVWRYSTGFDSVYSTPCYVEEVLYFGSACFGRGDGEAVAYVVVTKPGLEEVVDDEEEVDEEDAAEDTGEVDEAAADDGEEGATDVDGEPAYAWGGRGCPGS